MAQLIKQTGEIIEVKPRNGKDFNLQELYDALDCETIDIVGLTNGKYMVVDDEGRFKGKNQVNEKATKLYVEGRMNPEALEREMNDPNNPTIYVGDLNSFYTIVGDALVCDPDELD